MLKNKAAKALDLLRDRLIRSGLSKGQKEYTPFIILGRFRTGSNFLLTALAQHPNLLAYSEIFIPMRIFWGSGIYGHNDPFNAGLLDLRDNHQQKFIDQRVYRSYPAKLKAVGFKIFYPHLEEASNQVIRDYLAQNKQVRIIHLKRRNFLDILVSHRVSEQTKAMLSVSEADAKQKSKKLKAFQVSIEEASTFFRQLEGEMLIYDELFKDHEVLNLEYQNLAGDFSGTVKTVQEFLKVPVVPLKSATKKQNKRSKQELISNFSELKEHFAGSPYESFF